MKETRDKNQSDSRDSEELTRDPLEKIAESYLERYRRGESPAISEYVRLYPHLEDGIRQLFPTLEVMEELAPAESSSPPARPPLPDMKLRQLGEYRVVREIGRGGMGIVYEAVQESLGRHVALKVLPGSTLTDEVQVERFRQEARAAARLHHTNIVPVFGVGEAEGVHYYAMQFIRGQSLAEVFGELRRMRGLVRGFTIGAGSAEGLGGDRSVARDLASGQFFLQSTATCLMPEPSSEGPGTQSPEPEEASEGAVPVDAYYRSVARLGLQVAEALAYAHSEGILHRDIKPSNLLIDTRGTAWVTDFGLAKLEDSVNLTQEGNVVGTLRYMAPERLQGHSDARSDVYSIGMTLYELLTLRPAFEEKDRAGLVRSIATREPTRPRKIDRAIPKDLETIVLKAVAKEPGSRYLSCQALADDLSRFLAYQPIAARRAYVHERFLRWCRRRPAVATLSLTTVALLVLLASGAVFFALRLAGERNTAYQNLDRALDAEQEVRHRLALARLEEGRAWRNSDRSGRRARGLAALREAAQLGAGEQVRSELIGILSQTDLEVIEEYDTDRGWMVTGPFHELLAVVPPEGPISVCHADNPDEVLFEVPPCGSRLKEGRFSPGGRYLALKYYRRGDPVDVWDLESRSRVATLPNPGGAIALAFHPAEDRLALGRPDGSVVEVTLPEGEVGDEITNGPEPWRLEYSPTGRWLAVLGADKTRVVRVLEGSTGKTVARLVHPHSVVYAAWHPEDPVLATACFDYRVHLWNVEEGRQLRVLDGHTAQVTRVAFHPEGQLLASGSWDGRTVLWNHRTGHRIVAAYGMLTSFRRRDGALGFSVADYRRGLWKIAGGEEYRLLAAPVLHDKGPLQLAISPDGRWLAAACGSNGARIWSLDQPRESRKLEVGTVHEVGFLREENALLSLGHVGLLRWPIRRSDSGTATTFGPPEPLGIRGHRLSVSARGSRIAVIQGHDAVVYELRKKAEEIARFRHGNANFLNLSSSGRWLASSTWQGRDVVVWDVDQKQSVQRFEYGTARVRFSPDERWLVVGTGAHYRIYEAGSWMLVRELPREDAGELPGPIGFSGDSRLVALAHSRTHLDLYSLGDWLEGWEEVARFEPPFYSDDIACIDLGLKGEFLAASMTGEAVHLWSLRPIRKTLAELGLDWEPWLEPAASASDRGGSFSVEYGPDGRWRRPVRGVHESRELNRLDLYTGLIALEPSAERYGDRADLFERRGYLHDALEDLDAALLLEPGDPALTLRRARLLRNLDRGEDALRDLDDVIAGLEGAADAESQDVLVDALRDRAGLHAEEGRYSRARQDYASVLDVLPSNAAACERLAWFWLLEEETDLALAEVMPRAEQAASLRPRDYGSERTLGALLYHAGRLEEAEKRLERAATLQGGEPTASVLFYLAMVRQETGRRAEAAENYQQAREWIRSASGLPEPARRELEVLERRARSVLGLGLSPSS